MQLTNTKFEAVALTQLLSQFRSLYLNGGAEFVQFQVTEFSLQQWFSERTWQDELSFPAELLQHSTVITALPTLQIPFPLSQPMEIELGSAFTLDGELAEAIYRGGVYKAFSELGAVAKAIGQQFCIALFGDRYEEIVLYKSHSAWSPWFGAVGWDCTWIGLDLSNNQVWILAITDRD